MNAKQRRKDRTERALLWAGRVAKGIERRAEEEVAQVREQVYAQYRAREEALAQVAQLRQENDRLALEGARLACELEALRQSNHTLQGAIAKRDQVADDLRIQVKRTRDRVAELEAHVDFLQGDARNPDKLIRIAAARQRDLDAARARIRHLEHRMEEMALPRDIHERFPGVPLGALLGAVR
jgi:hypothetical protein